MHRRDSMATPFYGRSHIILCTPSQWCPSTNLVALWPHRPSGTTTMLACLDHVHTILVAPRARYLGGTMAAPPW